MRRLMPWLATALLTFTLTLLTDLQPAQAQFGFHIGAFGGEDFAGAQTLPSPFQSGNAQGASGYTLGILFDKSLVGPLSLETEMMLTQRTFKDVETLPSGTPDNASTWVEKLQYLQIPILLKLSPFGGAIQPFVFLGPNIGFKIDAQATTQSAASTQTVDQNAVINSLDFGLDAGGGLAVQIFPLMSIFADGRFTYGLTDAYNHYTAAGAGDLSARDFKWTAGLMFGF